MARVPASDYTSPSWADVGVEFTSGGYSAPSFGNVSFQWLSTLTQVMNVGATITGKDYKQETYSEVTRRNVIALGFSDSGWQILQGPTEYTGFRDIGAYIMALSVADLGGIIEGFIGVQVSIDLPASITVVPIAPKDLAAYLKAKFPLSADLGALIGSLNLFNLSAWINGVFKRDLPSVIFGIAPVDLGASIKAWYQTDLGATLSGWAERDLGAFLKVDVRDYIDLGAHIGVYVWRDLGAYIKGGGVKVPFDLGAYLNPLGFADLAASIRGREKQDLGGIIYGIPPFDLSAIIHGWQEVNLGASINPFVDFRKDLTAVISLILPKELPAIIQGWAFRDLGAIVGGWAPLNLGATINPIGWANLGAIIGPTGQSADLIALITPRLIKLAVLLPVHTMEYLDLNALINLQPCYNLGIADLGAYMKIWQKLDLTGTIYGIRPGINPARDLLAFITGGERLYEKRALDDLTPKPILLARDDLKFLVESPARSLDDLPLGFVPHGGRRMEAQLNALLIGHFTSLDLAATITTERQSPYRFGDPIFGAWTVATEFGAPYIYKNTKLWQRLVSIVFYSQVYEYFYQSVSNRLWKTVDTQKWILNVSSWLEEDTYLQDKKSLREKLINDIVEFESVDEAVRYAIDWVISFPIKDLGAQITSRTWWDAATNPTMKDLAARVTGSGGVLYSSYSDLSSRIVSFHPRDLVAQMRVIDWWGDLGATCTGVV
jgi:hypothetical protein